MASADAQTTPRVLAIDDDRIIARMVCTVLESRGMLCQSAFTGSEGVVQARDWKPDVVLLDINLPDLSGVDVLKGIRAGQGDTFLPVIMLTSEPGVQKKVETLGQGADDYLTKPVSPLELIARVQVQYRTKRLHDELQAANARLRELEAQREHLTRFIVHDLKNSVAAARMGLELGLQQCASDPIDAGKFRSLLSRCLASVDKMQGMTDDLLDVSRLEEGKLPLNQQPHEVAMLLSELKGQMELLANSGRAQLIVSPPTQGGRVLADKALLLRVLTNLVGNAIKFSKAGDRRVQVAALSDAPRCKWIFHVQDNGVGIAPEHLGKVFEKFFRVQLKEDTLLPGTGLGLTFCRLAVEAHGGRIWVRSALGRGSCFSLELQAAAG